MKKTTQTERPKIALFDFDGTLTHKDSFWAFLKFTHGKAGLLRHFMYLWPVLFLYKAGLLPNYRAKKIVFRHFYKNWPAPLFQEKSKLFCSQVLPKILNTKALAKLNWHQKQGHRVVIVSAMFEPVLQPWCTENQVRLIATKLEIKNGKITGNFSSGNCYGQEKVSRIKLEGLLENKPFIYAYGDSAGDKPLLALADEAFYRKF